MTEGNFYFTLKTENRKLGPMPASFSPKSTCPSTCPMKDKGCYAKSGPMSIHWRLVSEGQRGTPWKEFLGRLQEIPKGTVWRFAEAGDLPGSDTEIDIRKMREFVSAAKGSRPYTYTHKPPTPENIKAVKYAVKNGFTVSLSAEGLEMADRYMKYGVPVVTVVPLGTPERFVTPEGHRGVVCPAQTKHLTCSQCKLCAQPKHPIVGFLPHGSAYKFVDTLARKES